MKLGAQFYTIRDKAKTPEGIRESLLKMKEIGYTVAQMSGIGPIEAELLRDYAEEAGLPITCTHSSFDRIVNDTDALIKEHIIYGCPVIGIGAMPVEYRESLDAAKEFVKIVSEPIKRIKAAGLSFAYHNHAFEFDVHEGGTIMDYLVNEVPEIDFILDTYWVVYGGHDPLEYIKRIGKERMSNVHLKDMKTAPKGDICPCGEGIMNFAPIVDLCNELGIPNALVEQDNAPDLGDSWEQMATSYASLKHLF